MKNLGTPLLYPLHRDRMHVQFGGAPCPSRRRRPYLKQSGHADHAARPEPQARPGPACRGQRGQAARARRSANGSRSAGRPTGPNAWRGPGARKGRAGRGARRRPAPAARQHETAVPLGLRRGPRTRCGPPPGGSAQDAAHAAAGALRDQGLGAVRHEVRAAGRTGQVVRVRIEDVLGLLRPFGLVRLAGQDGAGT